MQVQGGQGLRQAHLISFDKLHVLDEFKPDIAAFAAVSDPDQHQGAVKAAMDKIASAGKVGARLAMFATISRDLDIVCWPGVPGEFLCPEEARKVGRDLDRPSIMWDPYVTFQYFATGQPGTDIQSRVSALQQSGLAIGQAPTGAPSMFKATLMPAWVVLAHEIGHFYHYRHESSWFVGCLNAGNIAEIERRNLEDHENPILRHIGLPTRANYQDFKGGSNDTADKHIQWDAMPHADPALCASMGPDLARAKASFEDLLRDRKRRKTDKDSRIKGTVPTASAKKDCPKCGKPFAPAILTFHQKTCKG